MICLAELEENPHGKNPAGVFVCTEIRSETMEEMKTTAENIAEEKPELLYAEDAAPGRNMRAMIRGGEGSKDLTDRDKNTLQRIRDLAEETPTAMADILRDDKVPATAKIRLIEIILDRAYGKAEATVNLNAAATSLEASEMRIEALVRSIQAAGNPYWDE